MTEGRCDKATAQGRACMSFFAAFTADTAQGSAFTAAFRSDGALPPRCVLHMFLADMGVKGLHQNLWMGAPLEKLYREDLDRFTAWFKVVNADGPTVSQARSYKRLRKRVAMLREDRATPDMQAMLQFGWPRGPPREGTRARM